MRLLERVERAVDFNAAECFGRETQFVLLRQPGRIELSTPALVPPAGNADPDVAYGHSNATPLPGNVRIIRRRQRTRAVHTQCQDRALIATTARALECRCACLPRIAALA